MCDYVDKEEARNEIVSLMKEMKLTVGDTTVWQDFIISPTEAVHALRWMPSADVVEVVRCKDCKHRPSGTGVNHDLVFPDGVCPCQVEDFWYSWKPDDDWFCKDGERKENEKMC